MKRLEFFLGLYSEDGVSVWDQRRERETNRVLLVDRLFESLLMKRSRLLLLEVV
jgi:hypothetical protein